MDWLDFSVHWSRIAWTIGGIIVFIFLVAWAYSARYRKVGPNQVLIVYGKGRRFEDPTTGERVLRGFRIVRSGGTFVWPIIEDYAILSLEIMTLDITPPAVYSVQGVPVVVEGVAQIKVRGDEVAISTAAEQFLGKSQEEIARVALQTLEGHLRAIIGAMNVEDIVTNRDAFAQRVQEVAASDLANMGLTVISFVIKDIRDTQGYLEAWGAPRIAQVKRDATIGQAEATRDATIRSAQANQEGQTAKFLADTKIAESERDYKIRVAEYNAAVAQRKAEADLSYDLQKFKTEQTVRVEEVQVEVIEKQKQTEVQAQEIIRRESELAATVRKPAEAERQRIQQLAEAEQYRLQTTAAGQAEAVRATGLGEADAIRAKGLAEAEVVKAKGLAEADIVRATGFAEAESMAKKAQAWQAYNEAAILQMFIERLPDVAKAVAEPLSRLDKIVIVGGGDGNGATGASKITKDVTNVIAQLPPMIEALTGLKLEDLVARIPHIIERKPDGDERKRVAVEVARETEEL